MDIEKYNEAQNYLLTVSDFRELWNRFENAMLDVIANSESPVSIERIESFRGGLRAAVGGIISENQQKFDDL